MKRFSQILCVAFLVAQVRGQNCVEETLNCDDPVPTIFKLGDQSCACNSAGHAGALKFLNGKVQVCLGNEWKTFQFVEDIEYGTEKNPGSSCKDIKDKAVGKQLSNGVFWIKLQGVSGAFPVYCDMDAGGWTLVFKAVSGVDKKIWDTYNSAQTSSESVDAALDVTNQFKDHYKNRVVLYWSSFNPSQAKVVLYTGAASQKELLFNAVGTDKLNWFSVDKLVSSSWTDIKSERRNFFSIQGGCSGGNCRSFFINRNYGGCGVDAGWLVTAGVWCSWETNADHTKRVLYSKLSTYTDWNVKNNVGVADVLAVFLM